MILENKLHWRSKTRNVLDLPIVIVSISRRHKFLNTYIYLTKFLFFQICCEQRHLFNFKTTRYYSNDRILNLMVKNFVPISDFDTKPSIDVKTMARP